MATQQLQLVCDSSTLVNFKAWAQPISDWMRSVGYNNTSDTGQLNGAGGGDAGWNALSSVPGSGAFFYEIFKSGSSITPAFYVKLEYGNVSGTNCPSIRISIGTGTNGAGTLTGYFTPATNTNASSFTPPSTTTQYECDFSGDSATDRVCIMMWRNGTNSCQQFFAIQRSLNSSGGATGSYVSLWTCGNGNRGIQQTVVFSVGIAPPISCGQSGTVAGVSNVTQAMSCRAPASGNIYGLQFSGSIPFDCCSPVIGYWDNECTVVGSGDETQMSEGVTFTVMMYGVSKTYIPSKAGPFAYFANAGGSNGILCMEYD